MFAAMDATQIRAETMPLPPSRPDSPYTTSSGDDEVTMCSCNSFDHTRDHIKPLHDANPTSTDINGMNDSKEPGSKESSHCGFVDSCTSAVTTSGNSENLVKSGAENRPVEDSGTVNDVSAGSHPKYLDRFDTKNHGDVVKYFFTSDTRHRSLSPVRKGGCTNLQFCKESDLFIKAKGSDGSLYVFEVHSGMLAAASPIFSSMVYESHTRGNKEEWVWEFDDSPIGLRVMFSILHLNVHSVIFAHGPKPHQIYQVLRVLDKYEVEDTSFYPWAKSWIDGLRKGSYNTILSHHELLYIAYKLGDFKSLKRYIRKVAYEIESGPDGLMRLDNGKLLQEVIPIAYELEKAIQTVRRNDLEALLKPFREAYKFLMDETKIDEPKFCKSINHHTECNEKLLGSLLGNLLRQQLHPVPDPMTYKGSVGKLVEKIGKMEIRGLYLPGLEPHKQRHGQCRLDHEAARKKITDCKAQLPLSTNLLEHMYLTAKRVGNLKDEKAEFKDYKDQVNDLSMLYREEFRNHIWGWEDREGSTDVDSVLSEEDSGVVDDST